MNKQPHLINALRGMASLIVLFVIIWLLRDIVIPSLSKPAGTVAGYVLAILAIAVPFLVFYYVSKKGELIGGKDIGHDQVQHCPKCGAEYNPDDYLDELETIRCPSCKAEIRKKRSKEAVDCKC